MNEATKERLKRLAPKIGYPLFYLLCLVIFLSWTFPYDHLKERIVTTFNAAQRTSPSPTELQIEELDSSWITGVKAKGVRLISPSSDPTKPPAEIRIDEARARISLLGLLAGNKNVSFRVDAFDGTIKGTFEDSGKERNIEVDFDGVDMSKIDLIAANVGFPLDGRLNGTVKLQLPEGKASKGNGNVALEIRDMFAGNAKELTVKTPLGPFTLPRLKVGNFQVNGDAKDGILKLTKIGASGGDVDVTGDGRVQLREVATDAHLDVALKFKINDGYRNKNDKTKMLFGAPGSKDKPMLEMDPRMAKSKTADGYYGLKVGGTLAKPDPQPAAAAGGTGTGGGGFNFK
ncbi:MAG: ral secretion pathway protein [Labilithrix sp.]|nr:ral secretion pathway protein [Labilithrix sp.]